MAATGENDPLCGAKVCLRAFVLDDVDVVTRACQEEEIHRWTVTLPWPYTAEHALAWIQTHPEQSRDGTAFHFAVVDRTTGGFCGSISMERSRSVPKQGGLGYWIAPWARNRGFASDALRVLAASAMDLAAVERLVLVTMTGNVASERVAQRASFAVVSEDTTHAYGMRDGTRYGVKFWQRPAGPA